LNSVTHGLTAQTLILPGEDEWEYQRRLAAWTHDLAPCNAYEEELVPEAVRLSWRLDRADRVQAALQADRIAHRPADEARRRRDEVADLAGRLWPVSTPPDPAGHPEERSDQSRRMGLMSPDDPDHTDRLVSRLEATAEGCRWLLDRWDRLRAVLDAGRAWSLCEMVGAIRLLGKRPLDAADDRQVLRLILDCSTLDGDRPDPFAALWEPLTPRQVEAYRERLHGRGLDAAMAASPEEARRRLLEVVAESVEPLEAREATWREREAAGGGCLLFDDSAEAEWLRRQQGKAMRGILRIVERFRAARRRGEALSPDPPTSSPMDRRAPARTESIDGEGPSGSAQNHGDRPVPDAPDPGLAELRDPHSAPPDGAGCWSDPVHRQPTPAPPVRRPDPHTPGAGGAHPVASCWRARCCCRCSRSPPRDRPGARPRSTGPGTPSAPPIGRPGTTRAIRDCPADRLWMPSRPCSTPPRDPEIDKTNPFPRPRGCEIDKTNPFSPRIRPAWRCDRPVRLHRRTGRAARRDRPARPHGSIGRPRCPLTSGRRDPARPGDDPAGRHVTRVGSDP
jgi:hypothetical protein